MDTPLQFPNSPEGKRLLRAKEEFHRVMEQIKQHTTEERAKRKGPVVYAAYADENYVKAMKECESAERAYYMATGDESQLLFPPIPREQLNGFQKSVEKHFGEVAQDLNSRLVRILPWVYGFATAYAVVILEVIDVDRGIPPDFFVTLRPRQLDEKIEFADETGSKSILESSIGLGHIVNYQNPNAWENHRPLRSGNNLSDEVLKDSAEMLLEYGKSFLVDSNADWAGLQRWVQQERENRQSKFNLKRNDFSS